MDPRFFLPCFHGPSACKRKEKNSVHNLPYGSRTRLIRGIHIHVVCFSWCRKSLNLREKVLESHRKDVEVRIQLTVATQISGIKDVSNVLLFKNERKINIS